MLDDADCAPDLDSRDSNFNRFGDITHKLNREWGICRAYLLYLRLLDLMAVSKERERVKHFALDYLFGSHDKEGKRVL